MRIVDSFMNYPKLKEKKITFQKLKEEKVVLVQQNIIEENV